MDERTRRGKARIRLGMTLGLGGVVALPLTAGTGSKTLVIAVMVAGIGGALWAMTGLAMTYKHEVTQARARRAPFLAGLGAIDAEQGGQALEMVGGASAYNTMLAQALVDSGEASSMADALQQLGVAGNAAVEELHGGSQPAPQQAAVAEYPDFDEDEYDTEDNYPRGAAPAPNSAQPVTPPPSSDLWGA